jgi:ketosteroid isomerase-like protein
LRIRNLYFEYGRAGNAIDIALPLLLQNRRDLTLKSVRFALYACFLWAATAAFAQSSVNQAPESQSAGTSASATAEIEHLMADYHQAVASHDGARMSSMFIDEGSTWFNVLTDAEYARARAKNPAALKVRHSSFQQFANVVSSSHAALDPRHSNVQIHTDGTIASVYFDFVFFSDGKATNQGSETWQLVKASDGWKIAAITYSSNGPAR